MSTQSFTEWESWTERIAKTPRIDNGFRLVSQGLKPRDLGLDFMRLAGFFPGAVDPERKVAVDFPKSLQNPRQ